MNAESTNTARQFDTPFFVIRHLADLDELRQFVTSAIYSVAEWAEDKAQNPLCRLGVYGRRKYPDRVATICVKRHNLLDNTKTLITQSCKATRP